MSSSILLLCMAIFSNNYQKTAELCIVKHHRLLVTARQRLRLRDVIERMETVGMNGTIVTARCKVWTLMMAVATLSVQRWHVVPVSAWVPSMYCTPVISHRSQTRMFKLIGGFTLCALEISTRGLQQHCLGTKLKWVAGLVIHHSSIKGYHGLLQSSSLLMSVKAAVVQYGERCFTEPLQ